MKSDLLLLTLLYAVACTAFIGAINSRGPARVVMSYFLAILTLCAAVFHTSQFIVSGSSDSQSEDAVVVTPPLPAFPTPAVSSPIVTPVDTLALAPSVDQVAIGAAKNELRSILAIGNRISASLASLNLGGVADISDEEYESLQNKTVGFLSEARRNKEKLAPILTKLPESLKPAGEDLSKAIEALVTASYNAERFFKSENDTEEKAHLAAYRRGSQSALTLFKKAGTGLGSDSSDQPAGAGE
jgi:hypothetical protein